MRARPEAKVARTTANIQAARMPEQPGTSLLCLAWSENEFPRLRGLRAEKVHHRFYPDDYQCYEDQGPSYYLVAGLEITTKGEEYAA
jgi:hypothetical protein